MTVGIARTVVFALVSGFALGRADVTAAADPPTRFSVAVTGQGPNVILIPGLATSGEVWSATVNHLALSHRVHVVQVAGFGGRDAGANKADGDLLPALVAELGRYAAGLGRPAVIGHSLGGLMALEVAALKPDVIDRVMVVDALPFYALTISPGATIAMATPLATMMRSQLLAQTDAEYAASAPMVASRLVKSAAERANVTRWTASSDRTVVGKAMYEDMVTDARPHLPQIQAKTTVLYAFDSTMGLPQAAVDSLYATAYNGLAAVHLIRIDGSYHFIMLDQPEAFLGEVDAFLK
jgi:pimeloyl-ACP methyl ester carboxylesterase